MPERRVYVYVRARLGDNSPSPIIRDSANRELRPPFSFASNVTAAASVRNRAICPLDRGDRDSEADDGVPPRQRAIYNWATRNDGKVIVPRGNERIHP